MKTVRSLSFLVILIGIAIPYVSSIETDLELNASNGWIEASSAIIGMDHKDIVSSLDEGLRAEIFFQFKIYRVTSGFFSVFGDWLVMEKKPSYIAYKDFFLDEYIIETSLNERYSFNDVSDFIDHFLRITDFKLVHTESLPVYDECYILARVSVMPVKLEPPLHIIEIFSSIGRTTKWAESPVPLKD